MQNDVHAEVGVNFKEGFESYCWIYLTLKFLKEAAFGLPNVFVAVINTLESTTICMF